MILSQIADVSGSQWTLAATAITVIMIQVGKLLTDARKDKASAKLDEGKAASLRDIAMTNQMSLNEQREVKTALHYSQEIDRMRHEEVISTLSRLSCLSSQPNNRPTKKE